MKTVKTKRLLNTSVLAGSLLLAMSCDFKDWVTNKSSKAKNEVAIASKSCSSFKTGSQADGENKVILPGNEYKFNLYWIGGDGGKLSFWEDKLNNTNVSFQFNPLILHDLDQNNAEIKAVNCTQNKANAKICISQLENVVKMIQEARDSLASRRAAISDGKNFTFKCAREFADGKITELKRI